METIYEGPVTKPAPASETIKGEMNSKHEFVQSVLESGMPVAERHLPQRSGPEALGDDDHVFGSDEQGIRRASRALKKAREAAMGSSSVTDDGYDQKGAIVKREYSKDKDRPLSLREASADLSFTRKMERAKELIERHNLTDEEA